MKQLFTSVLAIIASTFHTQTFEFIIYPFKTPAYENQAGLQFNSAAYSNIFKFINH